MTSVHSTSNAALVSEVPAISVSDSKMIHIIFQHVYGKLDYDV